MKAVIYARFSSEKQNEASIEGQLRECMDYANFNSIEVIGNYIDRAQSAKTDHRPEFQRMIKDSYKHVFDCIIVWKLDRFARNRYDSAYYKNVLKKNGVRVISAKESISQGADGILLESILEGYAEYYSAELSEKVKRGMTENALKAKSNGVRPPFGYYVDDTDHYQIDKTISPIIKEIFNLYVDGVKITEIASRLKERGVKNRGYELNYNAIFRILTNRNNLIEAITQGIYSSTTKKALDELEERKRNLEIELFEAQTRNPVLTKEQILFALYNFRKIDISTQEGKQRLIDGFVNSIYLYDDHFVITYNYKGQSKTVTFEELNSSPLTSKGSPDANKSEHFCSGLFF